MIRKLWDRYREYIFYLIFGGLTTLVNWVCFYLCMHVICLSVVVSNIISWIVAVAFAYVTNRRWVFESRARGVGNILKEAGGFVAGRLLTLAVETGFLWATVDMAKWNDMLMKIIISIVVIILNYVISKFFVFRR